MNKKKGRGKSTRLSVVMPQFLSTKKSRLTLIYEVIGIVAALVTIAGFWYQNSNLKKDKTVIYDEMKRQLEQQEEYIRRLLNENYLLKLKHPNLSVENYELRVITGKVVSTQNMPISDVKIDLVGGSQVYSNSNGEFFFSCRVGQRVIFEKKGFKTHEIILTGQTCKQYQNIILTEVLK